MVNRCGTCGRVINRRSGPGVPCSGECESWHHLACCSSPVVEGDITKIVIGEVAWKCDACLSGVPTNHGLTQPLAVSAAISSGSGADEDLSMGALFARIDRLEGRVEALREENVHLRTELATCQALRSDIRALEYRLDAMTFWGVDSARPSVNPTPRPLPGRSFVMGAVGDLGGPSGASSPITGLPVPTSRIQYRDICLGETQRDCPFAPASAETTPRIGQRSTAGVSSLSGPAPSAAGPLAFVPTLGPVAEVAVDPEPAEDGREPNTSAVTIVQDVGPSNSESVPNPNPLSVPVETRRTSQRDHRAANRRRPLIVGTSDSCPLAAVPAAPQLPPHKAQIFVTRLALDVTVERIREYLFSLGIPAEVVILSPPRSVRVATYTSFRITIPRTLLEDVLKPDVWPPGAGVKEWFFRPRGVRAD